MPGIADSAPPTLRCRDRTLPLGGEPSIVGILNVTPDSFFDGGKFTAHSAAVAQAERLVFEGAVMLDIGGQSTRPGHEEISAEEEIARVVPVISALAGRVTAIISVDTYKPAVARAALAAGAHVLNDIYGLQRSQELADLAAEFGCPVIVMHHDAAFRETVGDTIGRMKTYFDRSLEIASRAGVTRDRTILDPGVGFAKTADQNLEILGRLAELRSFGCPLLVGASRKSVIAHVLALPVEERLEGTLAITALAVWQGVDFIRVHDVRANVRAARIARAIRAASLS